MIAGRRCVAYPAALVAALSAVAVDAQSLLYKPPVAATVASAETVGPGCNATLPFSSFVGKKIAFLAKTKELQPYGYGAWTYMARGIAHTPSYTDLAGKVGTIVSVAPTELEDFKKVAVKLDGSGAVVTAQALEDTISDIVLLDDLDFAKAHYVGKTLWVRTAHARATQDVSAVTGGVRIKKYSPVRVVDVVPGTERYDPLDFVVTAADGATLLVPVAVSATNVDQTMRKALAVRGRPLCGFDEVFFTEDPRAKHNWPEAVWRNIEAEQVVVGMTLEQVIMAKGEPRDMNRTSYTGGSSTQLVYPDGAFIYVNEKGVVTAVQD